MKHFAVYLGLATALVVACSIQEKDIKTPQLDDVIYYASFEQPAEEGTRVYANEDLLLRWNADDRVSIFGKNTYNQQYKFLGETGDNSGGFSKVDGAEYVTGNPISHTVSVYPYQALIKITEDEVLTVTLPAEQHYTENSFGPGANTMVSVSEDNFLQYKNVGGYLVINLYGDGVSVSSITLKGNNGEKIAGKVQVTMPLGESPSITMLENSEETIKLTSKTPVVLSSSADKCISFWFVLPPVTFTKGFTIVVMNKDGKVFSQNTTKPISITRNTLSRMAPCNVIMDGLQPNNVIIYTTTDGSILTPSIRDNEYKTFGAYVLSNVYSDGEGIMTFDGDVTQINDYPFYGKETLKSISLPSSVESIGGLAFHSCYNLVSINIPDGVTCISQETFYGCTSLSSITIPDGVTSIGRGAFYYCKSLSDITIPDGVSVIEDETFYQCEKLFSVSLPNSLTSIGPRAFRDCSSLSSLIIPNSVTDIGVAAFFGCSSIESLCIPQSVTSIGGSAFYNCSKLTSIHVKATNPPSGGKYMFNNTNLCPIYIPNGSEDMYLSAEYWSHYAMRMFVEGSSDPIFSSSTDYSQDGTVLQLQQSSIGNGINIVFLGDGFLDKDMGDGGKYELKMKEAMEQFFAYEPYYTFRNRFNVYAVKVVSENDLYGGEDFNRRLTYEKDGYFYLRKSLCTEYGNLVPNPNNQPLKICVVCNTQHNVARSVCYWRSDGWGCCIICEGIGPVLNHELGGHCFAFLVDEYVENNDTFSNTAELDNNYESFGRGANVDWRSSPEEVRWAHLLNDPRYQYEGLGVYEGGYLYSKGVYRSTENSMMRYNDTPFNAPSREQIYKCIMKYSEGESWVYDYEEFVKADERGRIEAADALGPWKSPKKQLNKQTEKESHCPPIMIDETVNDIGIDKDKNVIFVL